MPELVTCPSCGCRVLVHEVQPGRRLRCIGCERTFSGREAPAAAPTTYPLRPEGTAEPNVPTVRLRHPLCPRCHRPVDWNDEACPHCGHLFDPLDARERGGWQRRRDALAHRGEVVDRLGGLALFGGLIALCTGPLGAALALGCGLPAWWMARRDLAGMEAGRVDPLGRGTTEYGRVKAQIGVALALLSGLFWSLTAFELIH